jgi:uncharacterized protein YcbK (DUF882 family)
MKLTDHFSWNEMTTTSHSDLRDVNREEAKNYACAIYLTANLMERVRAIVGSPIRVTSGFRGPTLNARVGGSKHSQHMRGEACDWQPIKGDLKEAFEKLATEVREKRLDVGQLLLERGWIHISLGHPTARSPERCNEIGHQEPDGRVVIDERIK